MSLVIFSCKITLRFPASRYSAVSRSRNAYGPFTKRLCCANSSPRTVCSSSGNDWMLSTCQGPKVSYRTPSRDARSERRERIRSDLTGAPASDRASTALHSAMSMWSASFLSEGRASYLCHGAGARPSPTDV